MSTPLQRAEELKSLISQYQAELSDIYSEIHVSKEIDEKTQVVRVGSRYDWIQYILIPENSNNNGRELYLNKWNAWWYSNNSNIIAICIIGDGINAIQDNFGKNIWFYRGQPLYPPEEYKSQFSSNYQTKTTLNSGSLLSPRSVSFRPVFEI